MLGVNGFKNHFRSLFISLLLKRQAQMLAAYLHRGRGWERLVLQVASESH